MPQIDFTTKFKSSLTKLSKTDPVLFAEVNEKIKLLKDGYTEQLTIKSIMRDKGQYRIQEIVVRHPSNFRVFYIQIKTSTDNILLVDCRKKKVQKFPSKYFKELDKCIQNHIND